MFKISILVFSFLISSVSFASQSGVEEFRSILNDNESMPGKSCQIDGPFYNIINDDGAETQIGFQLNNGKVEIPVYISERGKVSIKKRRNNSSVLTYKRTEEEPFLGIKTRYEYKMTVDSEGKITSFVAKQNTALVYRDKIVCR